MPGHGTYYRAAAHPVDYSVRDGGAALTSEVRDCLTLQKVKGPDMGKVDRRVGLGAFVTKDRGGFYGNQGGMSNAVSLRGLGITGVDTGVGGSDAGNEHDEGYDAENDCGSG